VALGVLMASFPLPMSAAGPHLATAKSALVNLERQELWGGSN
jgi:hypothetical protein